ncbi:heterokaryon incompatibility protein-domain-containing protein [Phascolomyces articulosus]|uniref:Heterokaryon incompatibility protein-domain-containing protein n=1 Tax=Phascolomyces articulosus TaxID=60185 RepID=A0AAD5KRD7_9FUNG|nr:heterokaryon incompatibility protein-domain-containing protein [Phascolomyces articulosus]
MVNIIYCRNQRSLDLENTSQYRLSATSGKFRPTWLVKVSEWKKVPGKGVKEGYCTISYCWEQSGDIVKKNDGSGEYDCIDNKGNLIITQDYPSTNNEFHEDEMRLGTYAEFLKQLCEDFKIEYLWYDKICINQLEPKAKIKEIKEMHNIYSNACYTVAFVPEVHVVDPQDFEIEHPQHGTNARARAIEAILESKWWKRSWTLEEIMVSRRMLIVGINTNFWQTSLYSCDVPTGVNNLSTSLLDFANQGNGRGTVNQALQEAHFRTSTKHHDIILSLANVFPGMFEHINTSYKAPVQTLFNDFYRHIATVDHSILCFGSSLFPSGRPRQVTENMMRDFNLPSWSGARGKHSLYRVTTTTTLLNTPLCIDDRMQMHITTRYYWKIHIKPYDYGCFSRSDPNTIDHAYHANQMKQIKSAKLNGQWTNLITADKETILTEWFSNTKIWSNSFATHYHYRQGFPLTQLRPLSLTEDYDECFVLPILLDSKGPSHKQVGRRGFVANGFNSTYFLPVFGECSFGINNSNTGGHYKAIGIYILGDGVETNNSTFHWNHCIGRDNVVTDNSEEIVKTVFDQHCHDDVKEFIIE